jgi:hypothetical protein
MELLKFPRKKTKEDAMKNMWSHHHLHIPFIVLTMFTQLVTHHALDEDLITICHYKVMTLNYTPGLL